MAEKYFKQVSDSGKLVSISTGYGDIEITKAEYNRLLAEIHSKAEWVDKVYADPATVDLCPPEWRAEILQRVEERKAQEPKPTDDISAEEFADMVQEVL